MSDAYWREPLKWDRTAKAAGVKETVFCASMADVMDDEAPTGQRERLWELINQTPHLIWQLLTKRPTRYGSYLPMDAFKHHNVWLGTSAENQHFYNLRWSVLRVIAKDFRCVSFISYEPALGPLSMFDFSSKLPPEGDRFEEVPDWLICGGESGNNRRPMELKWANDIASECEVSGTQFFMKQLSARTPDEGSALIPANLLIRQFPGGPYAS
jgi:protein gp37